MASKEHNALRSLASNLDIDRYIIRDYKNELGSKNDEVCGLVDEDLRKAFLIMAELAKVETASDLVGLIGKCHAIAEE